MTAKLSYAIEFVGDMNRAVKFYRRITTCQRYRSCVTALSCPTNRTEWSGETMPLERPAEAGHDDGREGAVSHGTHHGFLTGANTWSIASVLRNSHRGGRYAYEAFHQGLRRPAEPDGDNEVCDGRDNRGKFLRRGEIPPVRMSSTPRMQSTGTAATSTATTCNT
jgi:hypothetical protein